MLFKSVPLNVTSMRKFTVWITFFRFNFFLCKIIWFFLQFWPSETNLSTKTSDSISKINNHIPNKIKHSNIQTQRWSNASSSSTHTHTHFAFTLELSAHCKPIQMSNGLLDALCPLLQVSSSSFETARRIKLHASNGFSHVVLVHIIRFFCVYLNCIYQKINCIIHETWVQLKCVRSSRARTLLRCNSVGL